MRAVILAGGKGTRLAPLTRVFPKPLMSLGDKPMLEIILRQLRHFGFTHITLAVGHMAEMIRTYVGNGERYGLAIDYSHEHEPLGTVGPLAQMRNLEQTFLVMNGNLITDLNFKDLIEFHKQQRSVATIGTYQKILNMDMSIVQNDEDLSVINYVEKPVYTCKVSMGIYAFECKVLNYIKPNKYLDFPDLMRRLLADRQKVISYPFNGYWLDIGNHSDYEKAVEEYESMRGRLNLDALVNPVRWSR